MACLREEGLLLHVFGVGLMDIWAAATSSPAVAGSHRKHLLREVFIPDFMMSAKFLFMNPPVVDQDASSEVRATSGAS